jgi:hypothetical protein
MDDTLHDAALADLRGHEERLRTMIDKHKSGAGYIATSNDGKPAGRSDEDLRRLEERADSSRADIENMQKNN